jgi:hypothetical protein
MQGKRSMATARGMNPFLKEDFPTRVPKRHGQSLPRCALGFPPYDTGARPHMSYRLAQSANKANCRTRSVQPPCGYAPLHLCRNQRSGRRTAAEGTCNRPAVMRPFIFAETSGQEGEQPRRKRANRPAVVRPLGFATTNGPTWAPGPHVMHPTHRLLGVEKSHHCSRQYHVSSGPSQKTEKINFQNQCSDSRHPAHGPTMTLSTEVTGQSTVVGVSDPRGPSTD